MIENRKINVFFVFVSFPIFGQIFSLRSSGNDCLQANRTAVLVHKLLNKTKDPGLKEEVRKFYRT
jgi:hypothetical protein